MSAVSVEPGEVVFELTPHAKHYAVISVHGGVVATLIDSVMGAAVQTQVAAGVITQTLDLTVHFVRAVPDQVGPVRAVGRVVHFGRRMATAEARLTDTKSTHYAHGSCSCTFIP